MSVSSYRSSWGCRISHLSPFNRTTLQEGNSKSLNLPIYDQWPFYNLFSCKLLRRTRVRTPGFPSCTREATCQNHTNQSLKSQCCTRTPRIRWVYPDVNYSSECFRDRSESRFWSTGTENRILTRSPPWEFLYSGTRGRSSRSYPREWTDRWITLPHTRYGIEPWRQDHWARRIFSEEFHHREWADSRTHTSAPSESRPYGQYEYRCYSLSGTVFCSWSGSVWSNSSRCTLQWRRNCIPMRRYPRKLAYQECKKNCSSPRKASRICPHSTQSLMRDDLFNLHTQSYRERVSPESHRREVSR